MNIKEIKAKIQKLQCGHGNGCTCMDSIYEALDQVEENLSRIDTTVYLREGYWTIPALTLRILREELT